MSRGARKQLVPSLPQDGASLSASAAAPDSECPAVESGQVRGRSTSLRSVPGVEGAGDERRGGPDFAADIAAADADEIAQNFAVGVGVQVALQRLVSVELDLDHHLRGRAQRVAVGAQLADARLAEHDDDRLLADQPVLLPPGRIRRDVPGVDQQRHLLPQASDGTVAPAARLRRTRPAPPPPRATPRGPALPPPGPPRTPAPPGSRPRSWGHRSAAGRRWPG